MAINEPVFRWEIYIREEKNRDIDWFWMLGIVTLVIAGISIAFGNIMYAIVIIVLGFYIGIRSIKKPRKIVIGIDSRGIRIGGEMHAYPTIKSFWVSEHPLNEKLFFTSKKKLIPSVIVPITGPDPEEIRQFLLNYLFEEEHHEGLARNVLKILEL